MVNQMLSQEIACYTETTRSFEVGDLVVAVDYKGHEVQGVVTHIASNGDPAVRGCGLDTTDPYWGVTATFKAANVRRAV